MLKYRRNLDQTCPYCGRRGATEVREHVISRQFFLERDRGNLPIVPSCAPCNNRKSKLENYVLFVAPLVGRQEGFLEYYEANGWRRLNGNKKRSRELLAGVRRVYERKNGILLETRSVPVDFEKVREILHYIMRGLYFFHFKQVVSSGTIVRSGVFTYVDACIHIAQMSDKLGPDVECVGNNFGQGVFAYELIRSRLVSELTFWRMGLFGGAIFGAGDAAPGVTYSNLLGFTAPRALVLPTTSKPNSVPAV